LTLSHWRSVRLLYGVYNRLAQRCEASGIVIERNLIGSYCTSLDMAGSLSRPVRKSLCLVKMSPQRYSQSTICVLFSDMSCSLFSPVHMHRGFSKVVEKLPSIADKDIGFILKNTGMTLLSNGSDAPG
jgi:hypothetical protein